MKTHLKGYIKLNTKPERQSATTCMRIGMHSLCFVQKAFHIIRDVQEKPVPNIHITILALITLFMWTNNLHKYFFHNLELAQKGHNNIFLHARSNSLAIQLQICVMNDLHIDIKFSPEWHTSLQVITSSC